MDQSIFDFSRSQRWFNGRDSYRPSREPINPALYGVEPVAYADAKRFVCTHHYSGTFSPCIQSFGLFRSSGGARAAQLVGVATFGPAGNPHSIEKWAGLTNDQGAELTRFVLLDEEPGNAETFFLARALAAFKVLRPRYKIVLSYSDPVPRVSASGQVIRPGHHGGIYQSANALFLGRGSSKTQFINAEGRVIANRILSKLRNGESGRRYAERALADVTGLTRSEEEAAADFVDRALGTLRRQRHRGNYLFAFALAADRREKKAILGLPVLKSHSLGTAQYPKGPDPVEWPEPLGAVSQLREFGFASTSV